MQEGHERKGWEERNGDHTDHFYTPFIILFFVHVKQNHLPNLDQTNKLSKKKYEAKLTYSKPKNHCLNIYQFLSVFEIFSFLNDNRKDESKRNKICGLTRRISSREEIKINVRAH